MSVQTGYSTHIEPPEQGSEVYIRCESCGRELLKSLGGEKRLPHKEGCPNGRE